MSNVTLLSCAAAVLDIPRHATDANFPAGTDSWSGTPTKVIPPGGFIAQGIVPGQGVKAQHENYLRNHYSDALLELQVQACSRIHTGLNNANGLAPFAWADGAHLLVSLENPSGTQQRRVLSPDMARSKVANMSNAFTTGGSYGPNMAASRPNIGVGAGSTVYYLQNDLVGGANLNAISVGSGMSDSLVTIPGAGTTQYTDIDSTAAGSVGVLLLGGDGTTFELARIPLIGSPGTTAITGGWLADSFGVLAQKPGENRGWQTAAGSAHKTIATTDGGVTVPAAVSTTWNGSTLAPDSSLLRPTWDDINQRWIASTVNITGGSSSAIYTNMQASSALWTSPDGIAWTKLHDSPRLTFAAIQYHRGLLWAVCLHLDEHKGMEIWVSRDGGDSWMRTGHVLTLSQAWSGWFVSALVRDTSILPLSGGLILFQTNISLQGSAFSPGGATGVEYVVLRTADSYT